MDIFTTVPPYILFFVGALLVCLTRGHLRSLIMLAIPVISGLALWQIGQGVPFAYTMDFMGYQLTPFRTDKLSLIFGYLFHIAAFIAILYAVHIRDTSQHANALIYAGSAIGAVLAGDFITLFVFLEIMAVSSVFLIWASKTDKAVASGMRYLMIQVTSGLLFLMGVMILVRETGSLEFQYIGLDSLAGWMIFVAIGIKCAFPLVHNWVTDAYPEATPTGAVFLCIFTTKTAVYLLARGYPGEDILIYIGAVMACFSIFYAIIENNLRRVLAYSLINQVGFMVCGIGIGTALAINGVVATSFSHVIYKGLLFMALGSVLHMTGRINVSDLGGLYKTMPKTTILCLIGAASTALPLLSGFVSKAMIMDAVIGEGHDWVWIALLFAAAGVFLNIGIKIPYFTFFAHDSGLRPSEPPSNMLAAMSIAAILCVGIGCYPLALYGLLPHEIAYNAYDVTHVLTQLQLICFSALAFIWLYARGFYPVERPSINLDAEWIYRRSGARHIHSTFLKIASAYRAFIAAFLGVLNKAFLGNLIRHHGPQGILSRAWPVGSMVLWVAILLCFYVLLYHI